MNPSFSKIRDLLAGATSIALLSHVGPDADTLGSVTAFAEIISDNFSDKKITLVNIDIPSVKMSFLPGFTEIRRDFLPDDFDLVICCDTPNPKLSGFLASQPDFFARPSCPLINIDHHITNSGYGTLQWIDITKPSTTLVLFDIAQQLGWKISPKAATALLAGTYTDTGSFLHSNTDEKTFLAASQLVELGADWKTIVSSIFQNNSDEYLRIMGRILRRIRVSPQGVAYVCIFLDDVPANFEYYDSLKSLVVGLANTIQGIRYSCVLIEQSGGKIRGSLRTLSDNLDTTLLAARFGGGGHKKASGFTLDGTFSNHTTRPEIRMRNGSIFWFE